MQELPDIYTSDLEISIDDFLIRSVEEMDSTVSGPLFYGTEPMHELLEDSEYRWIIPGITSVRVQFLGGSATPHYRFVKEHGVWRLEGIPLMPGHSGIPGKHDPEYALTTPPDADHWELQDFNSVAHHGKRIDL